MTEPTDARQYSQRLAAGSFWNLTNFVITGILGFVASIYLARYLHASTYGQYSFVVTVVAIVSLMMDLGFGQVFARYVPKYFHDEQNKRVAIRLFKQAVAIELTVVTALGLLAWVFRDKISLLPSTNQLAGTLLVVVILAMIAASTARQITSFLSSAHLFKRLAIATVISQFLTIAAIFTFGHIGNVSLFFFLPLFSSLVLLTTLGLSLRGVLTVSAAVTTKSINKKELASYASLAYVGLIIQFVVWSYSEVFFLRHFSTFKEIGYYTLAFSLSGILAAIPPLFYKPITNIQFELLERGEDKTVDKLTFFTMKYTSTIFLPLSLIASFLMYDLIQLLYGHEYLTVAYLFPMCLFGAILTASFLPITIRMINDNRQYSRIIVLTAIVAGVNILLDLLLIPHHGAIGAGIANLLTQLTIVVSTVAYSTYQLDIEVNWLALGKILLANLIIGLGLGVLTLQTGLMAKIGLAILAVIIYPFILKALRIFDQEDRQALALIGESVPLRRYLGPVKKVVSYFIA